VMTALQAAVAKVVVGNGLDAGVTMGPLVDEPSLERVLAYIRGAREEGATLAAGGHRLEGPAYANGYFVAPTIFTDVTPAMALWREEVFGPVLAVTPYGDFDEALALANDTNFGLAASLVTNDLARAMAFSRRVWSTSTARRSARPVTFPSAALRIPPPARGSKGGRRSSSLRSLKRYT